MGLGRTRASFSGYVNSLINATVKTIALQAATVALNAVFSMGITAAISLAIKAFDKFINYAKRTSEIANEAFSESNSKVQQNEEEIKSLDELISKYKELRENDDLDLDERKQIKSLQNDIADLVGTQAQNLDLVNGKLDDEIKKLEEISAKQAKTAYETATANYTNSVKANESAVGDYSIGFIDGYAYVGKREKEAEKILQDAGFINYYMQNGRKHTGGRGVGSNGLSTIVFDTYDKNGKLLKGAQEKADYLQSMIDVLEQNGQRATDLYAGLIKQRNTYLDYLDNQQNAANSLVDSWITYSQYTNEELLKISVNSVEAFEQYRQKMIEEINKDESIKQMLSDGVLSENDLENSIDTFMSTATQFSNWYAQWKNNLDNIASDTPDLLSPTISSTIDQLNTQLKPAFDALKEAYLDIFTTDDDGKEVFTLENVDLSMLDDIKSAIDDLNSNEDLGINIDYSSFDNLANVLTDTKSTAEDVHNAINAFAGEIIQSLNPSLGETTEETYQFTQAMLKSLGVMNSEEVMASALGYSLEELAELRKAAASAGFDLENATDREIRMFIWEQTEAGNCSEALYLLQLKKVLLNQTAINTTGDIEYILGLAQSAGVASNALSKLADAKAMLETATAKGDTRGIYEAKKYARELQNEIRNDIVSFEIPEIKFEPPSSSSSKDSASKAGKETADAYLEAFEKELERLQEMRDRGELTEKEYLDQLRVKLCPQVTISVKGVWER